MITIIDLETSTKPNKNGKLDPSPYMEENFILGIGWSAAVYPGDDKGTCHYIHVPHEDTSASWMAKKISVQKLLDGTNLLVGHNLKFDLSWLNREGFKYSGRVYDTMIGEYVLARGERKSLSLEETCKRRKLSLKASDSLQEYLKDGKGYENIPKEVLREYCLQDIKSTVELFHAQIKDLKHQDNKGLMKTVKMSNEFLLVLTDMENNGIAIDMDALSAVEHEYKKEYRELEESISDNIRDKMGDAKVNLSSPEQLSQLIFSRKVTDKRKWASAFNIGMDKSTGKPLRRHRLSQKEFVSAIQKYTEPVFKATAVSCVDCSGEGYIQKFKVNGAPYKNLTRCIPCKGEGTVLSSTGKQGGFGQLKAFLARNKYSVQMVSDGGFKTDKQTLIDLGRSDGKIKDFANKLTRYGAVDTYLNTFVNGIKMNVALGDTLDTVFSKNTDAFLHPSFRQCVTATGRLSSRNPNFQNQPRVNTFPIRKVVISRYPGGMIIDTDFSQLEFRAAVFLAQDEQGMQDVRDGIDVHQFTADVIGVSRQDAKAHTFKPLYGGTSGTEDERRYYQTFLKKYKDISTMHDAWLVDVLRKGTLVLPTGREYSFRNVTRYPSGGVSGGTKIKNYPVQGFATADIVPVACIYVWREMKKRGLTKSKMINTVHDSIVSDAHPDELKEMLDIHSNIGYATKELMKEMYDIDFNLDLDVETKFGENWLDMKWDANDV